MPEPDVMQTLIVLGAAIVPMTIATAQLIARPPSRLDLGALILTTAWNLVFLFAGNLMACLLYTSPSPRDLSTSRMPSSA